MNAEMLLDELAGHGIHLVRDGDAILADVEDGADVTRHLDRITTHKPALLALLALQDEIVRTASAARDAFDRAAYDRVWERWHALHDEEMTNP
jgi:hypothetical protein